MQLRQDLWHADLLKPMDEAPPHMDQPGELRTLSSHHLQTRFFLQSQKFNL